MSDPIEGGGSLRQSPEAPAASLARKNTRPSQGKLLCRRLVALGVVGALVAGGIKLADQFGGDSTTPLTTSSGTEVLSSFEPITESPFPSPNPTSTPSTVTSTGDSNETAPAVTYTTPKNGNTVRHTATGMIGWYATVVENGEGVSDATVATLEARDETSADFATIERDIKKLPDNKHAFLPGTGFELRKGATLYVPLGLLSRLGLYQSDSAEQIHLDKLKAERARAHARSTGTTTSTTGKHHRREPRPTTSKITGGTSRSTKPSNTGGAVAP